MIRLEGLGARTGAIVNFGVQSRKGAGVPPGDTAQHGFWQNVQKFSVLDPEKKLWYFPYLEVGFLLQGNAPNRCLPRDPGGRRCGVNVAEVLFPFEPRWRNTLASSLDTAPLTVAGFSQVGTSPLLF